MSRRRRTRQKMQFSKKLAVVVVAVYVLSWVLAWVTWYVKGAFPGELMDYISTPFMVVITGYFVKSGVENYPKITGAIETNYSE